MPVTSTKSHGLYNHIKEAGVFQLINLPGNYKRDRMNLKLCHFLFLFLPVLTYGQTCDTLYSHERYVQRTIEVGYRNCQLIEIDSIYRIVQWLNVDSNYLEPFFSQNICQSLFHSVTGQLIHERWREGDTTYFKEYYSSGSLKTFSKTVFHENPYYFHDQILRYYENGTIRYEGENKVLSFSTHKTYYPNGRVETIAKRFSYNPSAFGEYIEYFPNGQISMILEYSEPDTTTNQYQTNTLISEKYFDQAGQGVDHNLNEYKKLYLKIYPPYIDKTLLIGEDLHTAQQFEDQEPYANDVYKLKEQIIGNLDLSGVNCTKGIAKISLNITKKGDIELLEVDFENDLLKESIEQSIKSLKKWPAAIKDGEKVDTHVYTYLIIDK